ncbi:ATP-dependent DNA helicase RecG [Candidatus Cyanaurora vandensis]|uniref:ATP-dependent DNA helicase RecG n=1 Tax=Candidatus Cyanaurora vandensis TaxID=2714958 RepID=UPI0025802E33|nr:ATP-dependent DNA helicase RecG [Candidatus Cyanaurora vandensis]
MEDGWLTRLNRALAVEAEQGYPNLQGSRYRFGEFLTLALAEVPPVALRLEEKQLWYHLAQYYRRYDQLPLEERTQLVQRTQHLIAGLLPPPAPPACTPPLTAPLLELRGIGPKLAAQLAQLNLHSIGDALRYYPRDYLDYSHRTTLKQIKEGQTVTLMAKVRRVNCFTSPRNPKLTLLELTVGDGTGQMRVSQFFMGQQFANPSWQARLKKNYPPEAMVALSGLVKAGKYGLTLDKPEIEVLALAGEVQSNTIGQIVPVYPLTEGVGATTVRNTLKACLPSLQYLDEYLPGAWLADLALPTVQNALRAIHFPENTAQLEQARRRIVFEEFFFLQLGLLTRRYQRRQQAQPTGTIYQIEGELVTEFYKLLPFSFTQAQQRVVREVLSDLAQPAPMNRLVQGDVGSGKTVVAVVALLAARQSGFQTAFMAPTEVLAEQHYRKLCEWLALLHQPVALLTGSTRTSQRKEILRALTTGELGVIVGTHALIQEQVQFQNLGLVIIDEQHRFGVAQRAQLQQKGHNPDILTMTATPIPRTLALTLYGDLDVSEIDELPPGRRAIHTQLLIPKELPQAQALCAQQVALGHQIYVVLPLVEESEKVDLRSAIEEYERLQTVFPQFRIGLLHGRMKSVDKDQVLTQFREHQLDILVSTTVIEVGVDVPNASVMLIEHAERFGLAQLHQLRGRVGRGAAQSYCLLLNYTQSETASQRLNVLVNFQDGFAIAEMDLRLRGPGQVLGTRQSGLPDLALASLSEDQETLNTARIYAQRLMEEDPELKNYAQLHAELVRRNQRLSAEILT